MPLTSEQGQALADSFHAAFKAGFPANNHAATMKDVLASSVEIDWSDGFKGTKTQTEIFDSFCKSWGLMVSDFMWDPKVLVDTTNAKVVMMGTNVINVDGKMGKAHIVQSSMSFILGFDDAGKCSSWTAIWDNEFPPMLEALGKVAAALQVDAA
jgi:hypothetical protein